MARRYYFLFTCSLRLFHFTFLCLSQDNWLQSNNDLEEEISAELYDEPPADVRVGCVLSQSMRTYKSSQQIKEITPPPKKKPEQTSHGNWSIQNEILFVIKHVKLNLHLQSPRVKMHLLPNPPHWRSPHLQYDRMFQLNNRI